jgi:hypothetical protein
MSARPLGRAPRSRLRARAAAAATTAGAAPHARVAPHGAKVMPVLVGGGSVTHARAAAFSAEAPMSNALGIYIWAAAAWWVMRQKHDDLIGTSARARATSSCCLTIRACSGFPSRTRHSW